MDEIHEDMIGVIPSLTISRESLPLDPSLASDELILDKDIEENSLNILLKEEKYDDIPDKTEIISYFQIFYEKHSEFIDLLNNPSYSCEKPLKKILKHDLIVNTDSYENYLISSFFPKNIGKLTPIGKKIIELRSVPTSSQYIHVYLRSVELCNHALSKHSKLSVLELYHIKTILSTLDCLFASCILPCIVDGECEDPALVQFRQTLFSSFISSILSNQLNSLLIRIISMTIDTEGSRPLSFDVEFSAIVVSLDQIIQNLILASKLIDVSSFSIIMNSIFNLDEFILKYYEPQSDISILISCLINRAIKLIIIPKHPLSVPKTALKHLFISPQMFLSVVNSMRVPNKMSIKNVDTSAIITLPISLEMYLDFVTSLLPEGEVLSDEYLHCMFHECKQAFEVLKGQNISKSRGISIISSVFSSSSSSSSSLSFFPMCCHIFSGIHGHIDSSISKQQDTYALLKSNGLYVFSRTIETEMKKWNEKCSVIVKRTHLTRALLLFEVLYNAAESMWRENESIVGEKELCSPYSVILYDMQHVVESCALCITASITMETEEEERMMKIPIKFVSFLIELLSSPRDLPIQLILSTLFTTLRTIFHHSKSLSSLVACFARGLADNESTILEEVVKVDEDTDTMLFMDYSILLLDISSVCGWKSEVGFENQYDTCHVSSTTIDLLLHFIAQVLQSIPSIYVDYMITTCSHSMCYLVYHSSLQKRGFVSTICEFVSGDILLDSHDILDRLLELLFKRNDWISEDSLYSIAYLLMVSKPQEVWMKQLNGFVENLQGDAIRLIELGLFEQLFSIIDTRVLDVPDYSSLDNRPLVDIFVSSSIEPVVLSETLQQYVPDTFPPLLCTTLSRLIQNILESNNINENSMKYVCSFIEVFAKILHVCGADYIHYCSGLLVSAITKIMKWISSTVEAKPGGEEEGRDGEEELCSDEESIRFLEEYGYKLLGQSVNVCCMLMIKSSPISLISIQKVIQPHVNIHILRSYLLCHFNAYFRLKSDAFHGESSFPQSYHDISFAQIVSRLLLKVPKIVFRDSSYDYVVKDIFYLSFLGLFAFEYSDAIVDDLRSLATDLGTNIANYGDLNILNLFLDFIDKYCNVSEMIRYDLDDISTFVSELVIKTEDLTRITASSCSKLPETFPIFIGSAFSDPIIYGCIAILNMDYICESFSAFCAISERLTKYIALHQCIMMVESSASKMESKNRSHSISEDHFSPDLFFIDHNVHLELAQISNFVWNQYLKKHDHPFDSSLSSSLSMGSLSFLSSLLLKDKYFQLSCVLSPSYLAGLLQKHAEVWSKCSEFGYVDVSFFSLLLSLLSKNRIPTVSVLNSVLLPIFKEIVLYLSSLEKHSKYDEKSIFEHLGIPLMTINRFEKEFSDGTSDDQDEVDGEKQELQLRCVGQKRGFISKRLEREQGTKDNEEEEDEEEDEKGTDERLDIPSSLPQSFPPSLFPIVCHVINMYLFLTNEDDSVEVIEEFMGILTPDIAPFLITHTLQWLLPSSLLSKNRVESLEILASTPASSRLNKEDDVSDIDSSFCSESSSEYEYVDEEEEEEEEEKEEVSELGKEAEEKEEEGEIAESREKESEIRDILKLISRISAKDIIITNESCDVLKQFQSLFSSLSSIDPLILVKNIVFCLCSFCSKAFIPFISRLLLQLIEFESFLTIQRKTGKISHGEMSELVSNNIIGERDEGEEKESEYPLMNEIFLDLSCHVSSLSSCSSMLLSCVVFFVESCLVSNGIINVFHRSLPIIIANLEIYIASASNYTALGISELPEKEHSLSKCGEKVGMIYKYLPIENEHQALDEFKRLCRYISSCCDYIIKHTPTTILSSHSTSIIMLKKSASSSSKSPLERKKIAGSKARVSKNSMVERVLRPSKTLPFLYKVLHLSQYSLDNTPFQGVLNDLCSLGEIMCSEVCQLVLRLLHSFVDKLPLFKHEGTDKKDMRYVGKELTLDHNSELFINNITRLLSVFLNDSSHVGKVIRIFRGDLLNVIIKIPITSISFLFSFGFLSNIITIARQIGGKNCQTLLSHVVGIISEHSNLVIESGSIGESQSKSKDSDDCHSHSKSNCQTLLSHVVGIISEHSNLVIESGSIGESQSKSKDSDDCHSHSKSVLSPQSFSAQFFSLLFLLFETVSEMFSHPSIGTTDGVVVWHLSKSVQMYNDINLYVAFLNALSCARPYQPESFDSLSSTSIKSRSKKSVSASTVSESDKRDISQSFTTFLLVIELIHGIESTKKKEAEAKQREAALAAAQAQAEVVSDTIPGQTQAVTSSAVQSSQSITTGGTAPVLATSVTPPVDKEALKSIVDSHTGIIEAIGRMIGLMEQYCHGLDAIEKGEIKRLFQERISTQYLHIIPKNVNAEPKEGEISLYPTYLAHTTAVFRCVSAVMKCGCNCQDMCLLVVNVMTFGMYPNLLPPASFPNISAISMFVNALCESARVVLEYCEAGTWEQLWQSLKYQKSIGMNPGDIYIDFGKMFIIPLHSFTNDLLKKRLIDHCYYSFLSLCVHIVEKMKKTPSLARAKYSKSLIKELKRVVKDDESYIVKNENIRAVIKENFDQLSAMVFNDTDCCIV
ncbi:hypothetical protein ADUPG1_000105 [Aduncisulcus paluster]|uniref:Uncharacterized protein n=1 Tax=Aduncisulcus paluster TaxID=2918883 RepID=A0ABQ5K4X5_9EUKA|nr:hypothetical protein ADUPG1_000105 [Aduncisulcus paluster]